MIAATDNVYLCGPPGPRDRSSQLRLHLSCHSRVHQHSTFITTASEGIICSPISSFFHLTTKLTKSVTFSSRLSAQTLYSITTYNLLPNLCMYVLLILLPLTFLSQWPLVLSPLVAHFFSYIPSSPTTISLTTMSSDSFELIHSFNQMALLLGKEM